MSILRLTFLGTSAAQPTLHRNLSGLAVKADADLLLFDCGEGSQRQMVRFGTGFTVDAVFFTHFHADHYLGIIGFLRTLGMNGREHAVTALRPASGAAAAAPGGAPGRGVARLPRGDHELRDGDKVERRGYTVHAVGVDHRINALGYVLQEDERPGKFNLEQALAMGIPSGPDFGQLQRGETVTLPDGRTIHPEEVLGDAAARTAAGHQRRHPPVPVAGARRRRTRTCSSTSPPSPTTSRSARRRRGTRPRARRRRWRARRARSGSSSRTCPAVTTPTPHGCSTQAREEFKGPVEVAFDGLTVELPLRD